ncbi:MAG: hypothetical protein PHY69_08300 [Dysgonamonadaceae bacterium]|jgi:hypothetical protein|nr:hypothetical protein [Dysgonamonadaceae bacterium]MDD3309938.1 hypothetical protein [Dysgonamonadaceae bacterium]MDD3900296.1 hypothetical protein [Dysgonamonadaceae bacterium]MDD4400053.1 hypothetical protein [Dysgonamonadaceae bacterium]
MRKYFILSTVLVLAFFLLDSCISKDETEYLSREDAEKIAADCVYFTKKGYELRLTAKEAKEKKIKPEDYRSFQKTIELSNKSLAEQLDTLGDNKLNFFFPEDRIEKEGLDPRIVIK